MLVLWGWLCNITVPGHSAVLDHTVGLALAESALVNGGPLSSPRVRVELLPPAVSTHPVYTHSPLVCLLMWTSCVTLQGCGRRCQVNSDTGLVGWEHVSESPER